MRLNVSSMIIVRNEPPICIKETAFSYNWNWACPIKLSLILKFMGYKEFKTTYWVTRSLHDEITGELFAVVLWPMCDVSELNIYI